MNKTTSFDEALAEDVLQNINNREALIERLEKLHTDSALSRGTRVQRLLYGIHNASVAVVEAINTWNLNKQYEWRRHKRLMLAESDDLGNSIQMSHNDGNILLPCPPFSVFLWNGQNYLQKMLYDLDFVRDIPEVISFLGPGCNFHRNPFLLPIGNVDELISTVYHGTKSPKVSCIPWKDVNVLRIQQSAFIILLDEYHRNNSAVDAVCTGKEVIYPSCLSRDAVYSSKFFPPKIEAKDLGEYLSVIDPPAPAVIAVCSARLLLNSVGEDITNKLVFLNKPIALKIYRLPLNSFVEKAAVYNPLDELDKKAVKIVYPFIMHEKMRPELMVGLPSQVIYLCMWCRALVGRISNAGIDSNLSVDPGKLFLDLEADHAKSLKADGLPDGVYTSKSTKKRLSFDGAKKENEGGFQVQHANQSIQTEENPPEPKIEADPSSPIQRLRSATAVDLSQMVPKPIAVTVNVKEGSRQVTVNGNLNEISVLEKGDFVRIHDAHESSDWKVSNSPTSNDVLGMSFRLSSPYDHSRIVAKEQKSRENALNRLCYPYRKDLVTPADENAPVNHAVEDPCRHVASDVCESRHSSLSIRETRIWKLVPDIEDHRPKWRVEYDDGTVPWSNDNAGTNKFNENFGIRISLEMVEQSCIDSPYPNNQSVHQQRVDYFEHVPLSEVIDEAFSAVCQWHPKGSLIDNVKWAKLSRKMKFLSNMKNSQHEIDMAFVRHSQDRKLDLPRFHAIFEHIASIQHPSLPREDALIDVVWSSIVMLPDVNRMMWKEAKQMAINVEAKRVCAQTRIAAFVRNKLQHESYQRAKAASILISKHVRRHLAHVYVTNMIRSIRESELFQLRTHCSTLIQAAWRRYFWRNNFLRHKERKLQEERKRIADIRATLREKRNREFSSVVFREVIRIDSTIAMVTIFLNDETHLQENVFMLLKVYVPTTRETFSFRLEEEAVRKCLEKALSSQGTLSWDEMLKRHALQELTKRLMIRIVRGRPIFLFSHRNIVEKGLLVKKKIVKAVNEMFILSVFRSPQEFVFTTYQPSTRQQMRTKLSLPKLSEWLAQSMKNKHHNQSNQHHRNCEERALHLLQSEQQEELLEWLVKRVVIRKNPKKDNKHPLQILLQFEAEEERILKLITKVQSQWRRLQSHRNAKQKTFDQYEKIYDRENKMFAYRNMRTDERQWEKPKLLGDDDLKDPMDEWRKEVAYDSVTGQKYEYYANYATGQSSWLSEEEAARLVQRRYRSKHECDLVGTKIGLPDVVKALKFIHGARSNYSENPEKLSNIVNYALLRHCLELDFEGARPIYDKALKQSPSHPLITRAYGIFLLASCQSPRTTSFQTACRLFHEADLADPSQKMFQSVSEIYFRWAVLVDSKNELALLNYALLHQCIYKKYDHAERLYRSALAVDPMNELVNENYRLFIEERYPGGAYLSNGPPFSVVRRSKTAEERLEWGEWSKLSDDMCPRPGMELFWFNRFTKETRFEEPDWESVWKERLHRSKCMSGKTSNWVEYYDPRLKVKFYYNAFAKQYASVRPS